MRECCVTSPSDGHHFEILDSAVVSSDTILIEAQTLQSRLQVVEAARTRLYRRDQASEQDGGRFANPASLARS